MVGLLSAWTHAVSKLKIIPTNNAFMALGSGNAFVINASLQGLDLFVIRKQFLDHEKQFFRFEETLPNDLTVQVVP